MFTYLFIVLVIIYSASLGQWKSQSISFHGFSDLQGKLTVKWTFKPTDTASVINHLLAVSLVSMSLHHTSAHTPNTHTFITLSEKHACVYNVSDRGTVRQTCCARSLWDCRLACSYTGVCLRVVLRMCLNRCATVSLGKKWDWLERHHVNVNELYYT